MTVEFRQRPQTYMSDDRYDRPKEMFKSLGRLVAARFERPAEVALMDAGCATGEFLYYLHHRFPAARLTGIDNSEVFIAKAANVPRLAGAEFVVADVCEYRGGPFDIVTCVGVLSVFDSFEPLLDNLLANVRPGGAVFVASLFNDEDVDVRVTYRDHRNQRAWNKGFNSFSRTAVQRWLSKRDLSGVFHGFEIGVDVERRHNEPNRAWTITLESGERCLVNGLGVLLSEAILEIALPE